MAAARPPSLLVSPSAPALPVPSSSSCSPTTDSPFRYVNVDHPLRHPPDHLYAPLPVNDADADPDADTDTAPRHASPRLPLSPLSPLSPRSRAPLPLPPLTARSRGRPNGFRIPDRLKPWLGIASWGATTLGFLLAIIFWKKQVFTALDHLALYLQSLGYTGHAVLFSLIFITTIPPFPLYSTLIILSGYTYGTLTGALISYTSALSGACFVFLLFRHFLRDSMTRVLSHTVSLQRVVRAIERRPKLLLLIRIAPYPYNVMNVLLAASHALPFRTYFACTALSLVKVLVHTSLGASMHTFADPDAQRDDEHRHKERQIARVWTIVGILLCLAILVYLALVARRAVDDELEEESALVSDEEACVAAEMRERAS